MFHNIKCLVVVIIIVAFVAAAAVDKREASAVQVGRLFLSN